MPSKQKKSKISDELLGNLKLVISKNVIKKQPKTAIDFPEHTTIAIPPTEDNLNAYSYGKHWYPITIVDKKDPNKVITTDIKVSRTVYLDGAVLEEYQTVSKKGTYWFGSVVPHVPGSLQLHFRCCGHEDKIEPLTWDVEVVSCPDSVIESDLNVNRENVQVSSPRTRRRTLEGKDDSASLPVKKAKKGSDNRQFLKRSNDLKAEALHLSPKKNSIQQEKSSPTADVQPPLLVESVLPYKGVDSLNHKTRLEPILYSRSDGDNGINSVGNKMKFLTLQSSLLQTNIPSSLVRALMNDREVSSSTISQQSTLLWAQQKKLLDSASNPVYKGFLPESSQRPTVAEMFSQLQERCAQMGPGGQFAGTKFLLNVEDTLKRMHQMFEYLLEDYLLYEEEKASYGKLLDRMREKHIPFSVCFGPVYFLRFIVLLVTSSESTEGLGTKYEESVRRSSRTSDQRIPEGNRLSSTEAADIQKLQEVLNVAFTMLDEQAHVLFV